MGLGMRLGMRLGAPLGNEMGALNAPPIPDQPDVVLGTKLVEWWTSDTGAVGGGAGSWTGRKIGIVLPAVGAPALGVDGALYNGQNVFRFDGVDDGFVNGDVGVDLIPASTKPYMYVVGRMRDDAAAVKMILIHAADLSEEIIGFTGGIVISELRGAVANNTTSVSIVTPMASASLMGVGLTTLGERELYQDGAVLGVNSSGISTSGVGRKVGIGCNPAFGGLQFANCTIAAMLVLGSAPDGTEESGVLAWAQYYYGTP